MHHGPILPLIVDLELTNACPADCEMCPRDKLPKLGVMKEAVFERLLRNFAASPSLRFISLCGIGEPLLHPSFLEWTARLVRLPMRPHVMLVTAGERLTPDVLEALESLGLAEIQISVQAVERELYQQLMPGLHFDKVMANLEHIAARRPRMKIALSYTEHDANRRHTPELMRWAEGRGLRVAVTQIHSRAGSVVKPLLLRKKPAVPDTLECRIFEKIAFIAWDGRLHYCCHDVERVHVVGDLATESLQTVNGRKADLLRQHGGPPAPICARCDDPLRVSL